MKPSHFLASLVTVFCPSTVCIENLQAVILAAGKSSRFNTDYSKLTTPICGVPMIVHSLAPLVALDVPITVVVGYKKDDIQQTITDAGITNVLCAEQQQQLGTGHALLASQETWQADNLVVINGDMPLVTVDIIHALYKKHCEKKAAISIVVTHCLDPEIAYGRIVEKNGSIEIIEAKHFTYNMEDYPYVNAGIYLISRSFLEQYKDELTHNEITHECYITDLVKIASDHGLPVTTSVAPFNRIYGVNTLKQLADVEEIKSMELIEYWMKRGVRFIKPHTIHLDCDVTIGQNTVIYPGAQLYHGTTIGKNCLIGPYTALDHETVPDNAIISPHMLKFSLRQHMNKKASLFEKN